MKKETKFAIYISILAFFIFTVWLSTRIFYQETPSTIQKIPLETDSKEETITFYAKENETSNKRIAHRASIIKRPGARATVFILHGFMCDKDDIRFLVDTLFGDSWIRYPVNTVTIDFRAHGDIKEGQCSSLGHNEVYDVLAIWDYVNSDPDMKNTIKIVYGFSMGAVASILAQSKHKNLFDLAIWDCPFESTEKVLNRLLDQLKISILGYQIDLPGKTILQKYAYNSFVQSLLKTALKTIAQVSTENIETCILPVDTIAAMEKINIPVFIIGCKNDEKVPVEAIKEIFKATKGHKQLWITPGRRHFDSYFNNPDKYKNYVREFIRKFTKRSTRQAEPNEIIIEDY